MKTDAEIQAAIEHLRGVKPFVMPRSFFGENNHEKIDVQIRVLAEKIADEGRIYDLFEEDDEEGDSEQQLLNEALTAYRWLTGQPFDGEFPHDWDEHARSRGYSD